MRIAFADPPYIGQSKRLYGDHSDFAGEVDHVQLIRDLIDNYDGWILCASETSILTIAKILWQETETYEVRILAWCKPGSNGLFPPNRVCFNWEPVFVHPCRISSHIISAHLLLNQESGFLSKWKYPGAKPQAFVNWTLAAVGAIRSDKIIDMFPGSGGCTTAIDHWRMQPDLLAPNVGA